MTVHDSVLVALISAVGSIIVAYLTTHQSSKPSYDELKKENEELKRKLKEEKMKMINDIVNWLISSGALTALFIFAWKYVKPWLDNKAAHASTEQSRATWQLLKGLRIRLLPL